MTEHTIKDILAYHHNTGVFTWKVTRSPNAMQGTLAGSINNDGYVVINTGSRQLTAQRLAWYFTHGVWPSKPIVHINGKKDDNRIENLKEVSRSELSSSSNSGRKSSTGVKGVTYNKANDRYIAQISRNHVNMYIGSFKTLNEARLAYLAEVEKFKQESN